jgi:prolyl-tRNA synthetase
MDDRDGVRPGFKFAEWELKGVPLRLELGPRDLDAGQVTAVKRHSREKKSLPIPSLDGAVPPLLDEIQGDLLAEALKRREAATFLVDDYGEFQKMIESPGGFLRCHWCGSPGCEAKVKDETKATIRCIPLDAGEKGSCLVCGKDSPRRVHFARAY